MEYRRLGRSGLEVGVISLGSWATIGERLDDYESTQLLATAYDLGINFFDNAETYADGAAEEAVGRALRNLRWPRETYLVSSKVYWGIHRRRPNTWGLGRKHLIEACHAALRRLGVDYLDLYLCHRYDEQTPLEETVRAMSDLVTQGKVLYWGTSEWTVAQVMAAYRIAEDQGFVPPRVEQLQYNILIRDKVEKEFAPLHNLIGIGITTWSPLAYGLLAGRYDKGIPEDARLGRAKYRWLRESILGADEASMLHRVRAINTVAREIGATPSQLALAWVLRNPAVTTAISGASSVHQLRDNILALHLLGQIDAKLLSRIDMLCTIEPGDSIQAGPLR